MAIVAELVAHLKAEAGQFKAEMAEASAVTQSTSGGLEKMASVGKVAFMALGVAAVGAAVIGVKAAVEFEQSHSRLVAAIKASGSTWDAQKEKVEAVDAKMRSLAFTDTDTEASLQKLIPAAGGTAKAVDLMGLAADIARGRHIELSAATDILMKVETGRVSMLGKLGIQTKDVTGATISQEEAIKRLSAMYGGQASTYADTFQGRIKVLEAQLDHLAVTIGEAVIPVVEALATGISNSITFFEKHKDVAIALGAAIASVLVPAMLAYVAVEAKLAGSFILKNWSLMGDVVGTLAGKIGNAAAAMQAFSYAGLSGFAALAAAAVVPVAIVAGVGAAMYFAADALGYWDDEVSKSTALGTKQAELMVKGQIVYNDLGKTYQNIKRQYDDTTTALKNENDARSALLDKYNQHGNALEQIRMAGGKVLEMYDHQTHIIEELTAQQGVYKDTLDKLDPAYKKLVAGQKEAQQSAEALATSMGITIPNAAALSKQQLQAFQKAILASSSQFGEFATKIAVDSGVTGDALAGIAKHAQAMDTATSQAIANATSIVSQFGAQAGVTGQEVIDWLQKQVGAVQQWHDDMITLGRSGIDQGILDELRQAGPKAEPLVQALLDAVKTGNLDTINSAQTAIRQMGGDMNASLDGMALEAGIKAAETAQVVKAYMSDMASGGTEALSRLAGSSDKSFAAMAYGAILKLNEMKGVSNDTRGTLEKLQGPWFAKISSSVEDIELQNLRRNIEAITSNTWHTHIVVHTTDAPKGT